MLTGIFTPGMEVININGVATVLRVADPGPPTDPNDGAYKAAHRGPVCIALVDVSTTDASAGSITINKGTWNGTAFTVATTDPRIAYVYTSNGHTEWEPVFFGLKGLITAVPLSTNAIQIVTTGAATRAHVRIQDKTAVVT